MTRKDYLMLSLFIATVIVGSGVVGWVLNDAWRDKHGRVTKTQVRDRIIDLREPQYIEPPEMPAWVMEREALRRRETQRQ